MNTKVFEDPALDHVPKANPEIREDGSRVSGRNKQDRPGSSSPEAFVFVI